MIFWWMALGCSGGQAGQEKSVVSLSTPTEQKVVLNQENRVEHQVFFTDVQRMQDGTMPYLSGVVRYSKASDLHQEALNWLYEGPTVEEVGLRLMHCQSTGASIISVENGIATVQLQGGCGGCGTHTIYDSIKATITQFSDISSLVLLDAEGRTGQAGRPRCLEP